ncbi:hypothetical protein OC846_005632 [Tilletia horrida]|uniref:Uncharacterized protein n=1 Tax=Tilletia horrida TaxID=155126 RepID=A0AAN6JQ18_9BASI|nr:hypothetical protein OC846_005632 [Tilletia horrida]
MNELSVLAKERQAQHQESIVASIQRHNADCACTRLLVKDVAELAHRQDEIAVPDDVLTKAVHAVVRPHNYEALRMLLLDPLHFQPADHPNAFTNNGDDGMLYLRQDADALDHEALRRYEDRFPAERWWCETIRHALDETTTTASEIQRPRISYVGSFVAAASAAQRVEDDRRASK